MYVSIYEVTCYPLLSYSIYVLFQFLLFIYCVQKIFNCKRFSQKKFCMSFGIGLFVSSDTCKGKSAYTRISYAASHWESSSLLLLLLLL